MLQRIGFVQQRSSDITYYLLDGPIPRGAVRILAEHRVLVPGGEVVLAIIGSSHFLQLDSGRTVITEVLSAERPGLEVCPVVAKAKGCDGRRQDLRRGDVDYRFELRRRILAPSELEAEAAKLAVPGSNRLSYVFPDEVGGEGALTSIEWQLTERGIEVETCHTYPDESAMVLTHTVVDLPERGATT